MAFPICVDCRFQAEALTWLSQQEEGAVRGGILADEMGMGKTLQMIALLLARRNGPTLVICPAAAVYQWQGELTRFAGGELDVHIYYGAGRGIVRTNPRSALQFDIAEGGRTGASDSFGVAGL